MYRFLFLASLLGTSATFASGNVTCKSTSGDKVEISWSITHGIGSPRFGAINVDLANQKFKLWPYPLTALVSASATDEVKSFKTNEVGYWFDEKSLKVHVTDDQITFSMLQIDATGSESFKGTAITRLYSNGRTRKIPISCSVE
jgi:hypothetical protein